MLAVLLVAALGLVPLDPVAADTAKAGAVANTTEVDGATADATADATAGATDPSATERRTLTPPDSLRRVPMGRALPLLAYRLPDRRLEEPSHDRTGGEPTGLPDGSSRGAAVAGGTAAALGSLAGGTTALIVAALTTSPGQTVEEGVTGASAAVVGGLGATAWAALAVAYFGEPFGPRFAGIPVGPNLLAPTDWQPALLGAAIALPVGLLVGGLGDLAIRGSGSIGAYAVAVPVAQGIGAAIAIARRRARL